MQIALPVNTQPHSELPATAPHRGSAATRPARPGGRWLHQQAGADGSRAHGADYVTIPVAAAMTGYSPKAIRRKIESGVWLEGREFRRAPDGHVLISVKGYESWVERGRA